MKIAQITYSGFGGLGSVAFSLIAADVEKTNEWVVGFIGDQPVNSEYPARCARHGVEWAAFRTTPGRPYRAWIQLTRWLDKTRPDAILCHSINSILACWWSAKRGGVPLISVEHTPNAVKTRTEWLASRLSMVLANRVVLLTPEYQEELSTVHGRLYRREKIAIIPNGIDSTVFRPRLSADMKEGRTLRIGMAARFSFSKRQDLLVSALEKLAEMEPGLVVELMLAGAGSELEKVRAFANASPLSDRISFAGLLKENEVAKWLRQLDVYVHATEGETLSTSLLQAMATGLPIVASDIPGVRNLLGINSNFGISVANDPDCFAEAIRSFSVDKKKRELCGKNARIRVEELFSNDQMLKGYLELISNIRS